MEGEVREVTKRCRCKDKVTETQETSIYNRQARQDASCGRWVSPQSIMYPSCENAEAHGLSLFLARKSRDLISSEGFM
jgi:hypothetical protein